MKIYVAAPWDERNRAKFIAASLIAEGHSITHDWWNHDVPSQDIPGLTRCAQDDVQAVKDCDVFILLNTQPRGQETSGKQVEFGMALVLDKIIYLVGLEWTNVFHLLPVVNYRSSIEEVIRELR